MDKNVLYSREGSRGERSGYAATQRRSLLLPREYGLSNSFDTPSLPAIILTLRLIKKAPLIRFILNETSIATRFASGAVLLDFIRYQQHLTGTKIGCREGDCGACTILVGELENGTLTYRSMVSCLMPMRNAHGKHIVTIEGINTIGLNPVQQAMADEGATQCGFCTPGFVVSLTGFCLEKKTTGCKQAIAAIDGNICRCTGYKSIERAAAMISGLMDKRKSADTFQFAIDNNIVPAYFATIKSRLATLGADGIDGDGNGVTVPGTKSSTFLSGGTDLYVQRHDEMHDTPLQFLFDDIELKGIRKEGNRCVIGAAATVTDLLNSTVFNDAFPYFKQYAKLVSSTPIRNMATVGGNFINASPIGDLTVFFLALNAQLVFADGENLREIALEDLYTGYKQLAKQPQEYLQQIWFELPGPDSHFHFEKVSKRTHLDIASVNTAILLTMSDGRFSEARIAAGGVAPIPLYLRKTSAILKGKKIEPAVVREAIEIMKGEISPISDARGSKEYKALLLGQLVKAHFKTLAPSISEEIFK